MSTFIGQGDWPYYPSRTSDGPAFVPVLTPVPKSEPEDEDEDDSPYCRCDNLPSMGEVDRNKCSACGKALK